METRRRSMPMTVGLSMFAAMVAVPIVALITTEILQLEHWDPAAGRGRLPR